MRANVMVYLLRFGTFQSKVSFFLTPLCLAALRARNPHFAAYEPSFPKRLLTIIDKGYKTFYSSLMSLTFLMFFHVGANSKAFQETTSV